MQEAWKRYRGGQTTPVYLVDLKSLKLEKVPRENSNDYNPVLDGRYSLFPVRSQWSGHAIFL